MQSQELFLSIAVCDPKTEREKKEIWIYCGEVTMEQRWLELECLV